MDHRKLNEKELRAIGTLYLAVNTYVRGVIATWLNRKPKLEELVAISQDLEFPAMQGLKLGNSASTDGHSLDGYINHYEGLIARQQSKKTADWVLEKMKHEGE